jgi:hypothetical protein
MAFRRNDFADAMHGIDVLSHVVISLLLSLRLKAVGIPAGAGHVAINQTPRPATGPEMQFSRFHRGIPVIPCKPALARVTALDYIWENRCETMKPRIRRR